MDNKQIAKVIKLLLNILSKNILLCDYIHNMFCVMNTYLFTKFLGYKCILSLVSFHITHRS